MKYINKDLIDLSSENIEQMYQQQLKKSNSKEEELKLLVQKYTI